MPDAMEAAQQFNDDHVADSLARHQSQRTRAPGRSECANLDCGAPISAQRQADGAELCVVCKRAEEAQAAHLRTWRGR